MLSDGTIRDLIKDGRLKISVPPWVSDIEDSQFQSASFEMRLGNKFIRRARHGDFPFEASGKVTVNPGTCLLASTWEVMILPDDVIARVEGKSTWGRQFLQIHSTAGFVDPGFPGEITLEITNIGEQDVIIHPGDRICQVSFQYLDKPALRPYGHPDLNNHYVGQRGPTMPHTEALQ